MRNMIFSLRSIKLLVIVGLLLILAPAAGLAHTDEKADSVPVAHNEGHAGHDFPNYHPLAVHFPIVLLLVAAVFQLLSFFKYKKELSWVVFILLLLGTIGAWLASTVFHAHPGDLPAHAAHLYEEHEELALWTRWLAVAALGAKLVSHFFLERKLWLELVITGLVLASAVTVAIAAHHGAELVHIEGVGPQGKYLEQHHH